MNLDLSGKALPPQSGGKPPHSKRHAPARSKSPSPPARLRLHVRRRHDAYPSDDRRDGVRAACRRRATTVRWCSCAARRRTRTSRWSLREEHRRYAFADTVAVAAPSAERRVPPCPYLPRCGGCPWQHLPTPRSSPPSAHRRRAACAGLPALEVAVAPVLASPREFGYRRRIKLRSAAGAIGYYAAASHELVAVEHCLLAEPAVDAAIARPRRRWRGALRPRLRRIELIGKATNERCASCWPARSKGHGTRPTTARVATGWRLGQACAGWRCAAAGGSAAGAMRSVEIEPEPGLVAAVRTRRRFTQVNHGGQPPAGRDRRALRRSTARPCGCSTCTPGPATLSLPLRRRGAAVTAVEQDRAGGGRRDAPTQNAPAGPPHARDCDDRAERARRTAGRGGRDASMRSCSTRRAAALRRCVDGLLRLAAPRLVYVACDPATLARDLKRCGQRYRIDAVQPIDMFPHTYHVETVVRATLVLRQSDPWCIVRSASRVGRAEQAPPHAKAHVMMHTQRAEV